MRRLRGLGFGVIVVALTVGVIAGVVTAIQHIPRPATKIEWVQRADAVVVQMKPVGFHLVSSDGLDNDRTAPYFTLYGDDTVIFNDSSDRCPCQLKKVQLSKDDVQALLSFIDDTGFFEFSYLEPGGPQGGATTYIYAALRDEANISGIGLVTGRILGKFDPPDHYRKIQAISARLRDIMEKTVSTGAATDYYADAIVLTAKFRASGPPPAGMRSMPPAWPLPQFTLASIAGASGSGTRHTEGDLARNVQQALAAHPFETDYLEGGQWVSVAYRPVLPYEEAFPEFDTQQ
jgi:hypothetical protein